MIKHSDDPLIFNTAVNNEKNAEKPQSDVNCPFCDRAQLIEIYDEEGGRKWVRNKFPTIEKSLMTVVIESDKHLGDISTYSIEENREVFRFAFKHWQEMLQESRFKSVLMFKNFGPYSGGTLRHPHFQIVGLEDIDGYEHLSPENFTGVEVVKRENLEANLSTRPIMGFVEFNLILKSADALDLLADAVRGTTRYLLTDYMSGHADSYNLFFYRLDNATICKVVPRFITSPYFIGYKIPQVNSTKRLEKIAEELKKWL